MCKAFGESLKLCHIREFVPMSHINAMTLFFSVAAASPALAGERAPEAIHFAFRGTMDPFSGVWCG